jgi:hypothetical protein
MGRSKSLSFKIENTGNGTLVGTIREKEDRDWLSVSPKYFESNDQSVQVTVENYDNTEGEYTGIISIESNSGDRELLVKLTATCVYVKPNPYNPEGGKKLTFFGSGITPDDTTIKIYTLAGELVKVLEETAGSTEIEWDGTNRGGEEVINGIYLYTTESPAEKNACSFTVIKR